MIKKLAPLFVSLFGVLFAFLLIEIGFRLFTPKPPKPWSDRPKEYFIHEASETFQDYPHEKVKPAGTYRIAVIGDSFTFAPYMQFDDAFPKRLERYLNLNKGQRHVEVVNYGVPAYSTNHEVPVVKRAIEEGADLILMQITFNDPEIKPYTPQQLYNDKNKFGDLELHGKLYEYWTSLAFVLRRLHNNATHDNYVKKFFDLFEKKKTWANFSNSWKTIAAIGKDKKTPIVAVVFPLFGIPLDAQYPFHPIHQKVKELLNTLAVPSHDLFADYEGLPLNRMQVIVGQDFHPNEIAHRLAAESILRWWKTDRLIPEEFLPKVSSPDRIGIRKPGSSVESVADQIPKDDSTINDEGDSVEE